MIARAPAPSVDRAREVLRQMAADVTLIPDQLADWWSSYLSYHQDRYLLTLGFLEQAARDVLEVGSVPAHFTLLLSEMGYDVTGVDLAPERIARFLEHHRLRVEKTDIETQALPFPDASFGTVLLLEVLEHLRIHPLHTFRELARVLRPGGRLLLSTPNISPAHRLMFLLGKDYQGDVVAEFRKLETLGHMGHVRLYSVTEIQRFLEEVGLTVVSTSFQGEVQGTWKTRMVRLLHPRKARFRAYTYVIADKRA